MGKELEGSRVDVSPVFQFTPFVLVNPLKQIVGLTTIVKPPLPREIPKKMRHAYHERKRRQRDRDKVNSMDRLRRSENPEKFRQRSRERSKKPSYRKWVREYYYKNQDKFLESARVCNAKLRAEVVAHLGGKCVKCEHADPESLHVDHIYGSGNKERRALGTRRLYKKVLSSTPGTEYQLLCAICNWKKRAATIREHGGPSSRKSS